MIRQSGGFVLENKIFLSTGALVEKENDYNYNEVKRLIPMLCGKGIIDGGELMVIKLWYEKFPSLLKEFLAEGCCFPVIHFDKEIGTALSDAAVMISEGNKTDAAKRKDEAFEMFRRNCEWGSVAGSKRCVLHLWGGLSSDYAVDYNIEWLSELLEISKEFGIRVLCENIPSSKEDPLSNWLKMTSYFDRVGLVFDTRFATCHRQPEETLSNMAVFPHIEHVHISDYRGGHKEFRCLRPVYHPGDGIADFPLMFSYLRKVPLTYTLESPGIVDDSKTINDDKLCRSLEFIKNMLSTDQK